jgi:hypothetical protein
MVRKARKIMKTTTNRGEYNRARRKYLEDKGELSCGFCRPNSGCNGRHKGKKGYGGRSDKRLKYPSWKLATKNRKQWMIKSLKFKKTQMKWYEFEYVTIEW